MEKHLQSLPPLQFFSPFLRFDGPLPDIDHSAGLMISLIVANNRNLLLTPAGLEALNCEFTGASVPPAF